MAGRPKRRARLAREQKKLEREARRPRKPRSARRNPWELKDETDIEESELSTTGAAGKEGFDPLAYGFAVVSAEEAFPEAATEWSDPTLMEEGLESAETEWSSYEKEAWAEDEVRPRKVKKGKTRPAAVGPGSLGFAVTEVGGMPVGQVRAIAKKVVNNNLYRQMPVAMDRSYLAYILTEDFIREVYPEWAEKRKPVTVGNLLNYFAVKVREVRKAGQHTRTGQAFISGEGGVVRQEEAPQYVAHGWALDTLQELLSDLAAIIALEDETDEEEIARAGYDYDSIRAVLMLDASMDPATRAPRAYTWDDAKIVLGVNDVQLNTMLAHGRALLAREVAAHLSTYAQGSPELMEFEEGGAGSLLQRRMKPVKERTKEKFDPVAALMDKVGSNIPVITYSNGHKAFGLIEWASPATKWQESKGYTHDVLIRPLGEGDDKAYFFLVRGIQKVALPHGAEGAQSPYVESVGSLYLTGHASAKNLVKLLAALKQRKERNPAKYREDIQTLREGLRRGRSPRPALRTWTPSDFERALRLLGESA